MFLIPDEETATAEMLQVRIQQQVDWSTGSR